MYSLSIIISSMESIQQSVFIALVGNPLLLKLLSKAAKFCIKKFNGVLFSSSSSYKVVPMLPSQRMSAA